jgi:tetratricopeptide (TPR) repeat protein
MATLSTGDSIYTILNESNLAWLLPNVRQDFNIWYSLNDARFLEMVLHAKPSGSNFTPADFSPASLALIALDQPPIAGQDLECVIDSVDSQIIQMAIRTFNDQTILKADHWDLQDAGLIALALAYNHQITDTWSGLLGTLPASATKNWQTAISCLYGLIDRPEGLLNALVQPACAQARYRLAIHAVLSNPIPPDEQLAILTALCYGPHGDLLPPWDRIMLVRDLYEQRPDFAQQFCTCWIASHPEISEPIIRSGNNLADRLSLLDEILFYWDVYEKAGQADKLADLLSFESQLSQDVYSSLLSRIIGHRATHAPEAIQSYVSSSDYQIHIRYLKLIESPGQPGAIRATLAVKMAEVGLADEAQEIFTNQDNPLPDDLEVLFSTARMAYIRKNLPQAESAVTQIVEKLISEPGSIQIPVRGENLCLINLGDLLLSLNHPREAVQVFEQAVTVCPNDAELLSKLALSYHSAHQAAQTAGTYRALASLYPANIEYHRNYAQALEAMGDWEASLNERSNIVGSYPRDGANSSIKDMYAYINCALKANHPEQAMKACSDLLARDAEDYQALIYAGQAQLLLDENDHGMALFLKATQISPNRADAWLSLASAQKRLYSSQVVVETLKNASQSVPGSAHIYFALGDLYLQDNAPSLALPELQSAVDLAPDDTAILVSYGKALKALGHTEDARKAFARAYDLDPGFQDLAWLYSQILLDAGAIEEAISPLEVLINSKAIHDVATYLQYARSLLEINKRGSHSYPPMKALIALNEVMQIDPEHAEAKALTAEALALSGENELAFQAYREALDTNLTEEKSWFERLSYGFGCVANAIGKYDVAIAALQEAGQANPGNPQIFKAQSEVYLAASLPEDSMRSARNVLLIQGDNLDNLAWFATQVKKVIQNATPEPTGNFVREIYTEALNALHQAIQLAPTLASLLLQLGDMHSLLGEHDQAKEIFTSMANYEFASLADLECASVYLSQLGDHESAIACLLKGISIDQANTSEHDPSLYSRLVRVYLSNHDPASAISVLDQAIELIPMEISLRSQKVDLLLELGQPMEALSCIESAVKHTSDSQADLDLIFLASRISRSMGDFHASLQYAGKGVHKISAGISTDQNKYSSQYRIQIAELYRALGQPELAYRLTTADGSQSFVDRANDPQKFEELCLQAELALDIGEQPGTDLLELKVDASDLLYTRLMAIKSRLLNKAGDYCQGVRLCQSVIQNHSKLTQNSGVTGWSAPYQLYLERVSLLEACLELGLWDDAQSISRQMIELAPNEPLSYLCTVRILVNRAQFNKLCEIFEVTRHKPSSEPLSLENYQLCSQYLDKAKQLVAAFQNEHILDQDGLSFHQIDRWQARMKIAFDPQNEPHVDPCEILSRQFTPEDSAALISYLRGISLLDADNDALNRIIKLARAHPSNPAVILQVALALQDRDAHNAVKSLQSVMELNPSSNGPIMAFCNLLLARLAQNLNESAIASDAIEAAISFWQDEPGWHAFAAQVYMQKADLSNAIAHLSTATQLAPEELTYHLDLGNLYLQNAGNDPHILSRALAAFTQAQALDGNHVPVLISLANTQYRLNDLKDAEENARQALILAPNQAYTYQLLSEIAISRQDFQGAYEYANKAFLINPKDIQSSVTLSKSLAALGRHEEALVKLDAVINKNQESSWLLLERVNLLWKKDGPQAALAELLRLVDSYPHDFDILNALSKSYLEVGELDHAVSLAQQALHACPDSASYNEQANLHLMIGKVLRQTGRLDDSIQHLNQAIQLAPDRLEPYLELGLACKERREYQQALKIFEQASLIAPEDPRALFEAGLAFKESKDYKSSESMLRRAVSLAPNDLNIRRQLAAVVALNLVHNPRSTRNYAR